MLIPMARAMRAMSMVESCLLVAASLAAALTTGCAAATTILFAKPIYITLSCILKLYCKLWWHICKYIW